MEDKKPLIAVAIIILLPAALATLDFRSENPIQFHNIIDMNDNSIENLADPNSSSAAVSEGYADVRYLQRSGDSMNGNIDMTGNEIRNIENVTGDSNPVRFKNSIDTDGNNISSNGGEICAGNQC